MPTGGGGGVGLLSGKVDTGRCGSVRVPFRPPRFINDPFFYLKIDLDIGCILHVLAQMLNFRRIFPLVYP